jgi:hypothetical protein
MQRAVRPPFAARGADVIVDKSFCHMDLQIPVGWEAPLA